MSSSLVLVLSMSGLGVGVGLDDDDDDDEGEEEEAEAGELWVSGAVCTDMKRYLTGAVGGGVGVSTTWWASADALRRPEREPGDDF